MASQGNIVAPCYHIVTDDAPAHVRHLYQWRGVQAFERELDYLLRRFTPLSLDAVFALAAAGRPFPEGSLFLSFDDGFREVSEVIAPLCRRKGVPATFFLTTGFLDNQSLGYRHKASLLIEACGGCRPAEMQAVIGLLQATLGRTEGGSAGWRRLLLSVGYRERQVLDECAALLGVDFEDYLRTAKPYLTRGQVRDLLRDGFAIGGHSVDHPRYSDLTLAEQLEQTRGCMEELENQFHSPVKAFAFPFVSDGVTEAFYEEVLTGRTADLVFCIGQMPKRRSAQAVQRFGVEAGEQYSLKDLFAIQAEGRLRQKLADWRRSVAL